MMDRLLENNTVLKVLSVIVGILLWIQAGAASGHPIQRPMNGVPVAVGYPIPNPQMRVLSISPSVVQVTIQGSASTVDQVTSVSALINLSKITKPGTYSLKVSASVPTNVTPVSVTPNRVDVTIAQMGQKKVPVAVRMSGHPANGFELTGYTSNVKEATISGPTSALAQVRAVSGTLVLANQSSNLTAQIVLAPVNAAGKVVPKVEVNPPTATITATIQQKPPEKVLPVVSQLSGQPASGYSIAQISVYPSSVTISGTQSTLSPLTHIYTIPVNVAGATRTVTEAVPVVVPKGTKLVSSGEVTVTVTIVKKS